MPVEVTSLFQADKPAGLTTHTSLNESDLRKSWIDRADGYLEWLMTRMGVALWPVHRLDRETTGVLLFASSREAAESARVLFESHAIEKEYLFITDREPRNTDVEVASYIERAGNDFVSSQDRDANARTTFGRVAKYGRFTLWRAFPETGKPHQIRLHAQDLGIPLLGDERHGGTPFPTLCLHALKLTLPVKRPDTATAAAHTFESPAPTYFTDLKLLEDPRLVRWLAASDRRERVARTLAEASQGRSATTVVSRDATDTLRAIHTEGDPLRIEQLGAVTSLNWFRDTYPNDDEWTSIAKLLELKNWRTWYLQIRTDRGKDPHTDRTLESSTPPPDRWTAKENGLTYEFRRETGLSPGLFLDQRENRAWVQNRSQGKRVLNLFCYTGGFSVAAAKGGASQVVSIDVSKPFLEWTKRNFDLNELDLANHEFRAIDTGEYLAWAVKKQLKFDLIVCDPPSFARTNTRGKKSVFRIEEEFTDLLTQCLKLAPTVLFSTNYEKWSLDEFANKAKALGKVSAAPSPDLDFELPRQHKNMKSIVVSR